METYHALPTTAEDRFVQHYCNTEIPQSTNLIMLQLLINGQLRNNRLGNVMVTRGRSRCHKRVVRFGTVFSSSFPSRLKKIRFSFHIYRAGSGGRDSGRRVGRVLANV